MSSIMSSTDCLNDEEMDSFEENQWINTTNRRKWLESRETCYLRLIWTLPRLFADYMLHRWLQDSSPSEEVFDVLLKYKPFEWSKEQKLDFSNMISDMELFKQMDEKIDKNQWFFAQKQMILSPKTPENGFDYKIDPKFSEKSVSDSIWSNRHWIGIE